MQEFIKINDWLPRNTGSSKCKGQEIRMFRKFETFWSTLALTDLHDFREIAHGNKKKLGF